MDELTSADILVLIQAVESLVSESGELIDPDSPVLLSPFSVCDNSNLS